MELEQFYQQVGGDLKETTERLGSARLLERLLGKFKSDTSYTSLESALKTGDARAAFMAVHTLKGVALNLGFSDLAASCSALTEVLRPYSLSASEESSVSGCPEEILKNSSELFTAVRREYSKIIEALG